MMIGAALSGFFAIRPAFSPSVSAVTP